MDKSKQEPRHTMLNIFAKFQSSMAILDKCGGGGGGSDGGGRQIVS